MALQLGALRAALADAGAKPELAERAAEEIAGYGRQVKANEEQPVMADASTDDVTNLRMELAEARTDRKFSDMLGEMRTGFAKLDGRFAEIDGRFVAIDARLGGLERSAAGVKPTIIGTVMVGVALIAAMVIGMLTFGQAGFGIGISTHEIARAAAVEALQQQHQAAPPAVSTQKP